VEKSTRLFVFRYNIYMEKNQLEEDIRTSGCFEELAIKASLCGCFEVNELVKRVMYILEKIYNYDENFIKNLHDKNRNNVLMLLGEWHDLKRRTECLTKISSNVKLGDFKFYINFDEIDAKSLAWHVNRQIKSK